MVKSPISLLRKIVRDDMCLRIDLSRHLAYWPSYLALVRTMLAPLQQEGRLNALTLLTSALGHAHGAVLASQLKPAAPPDTLKGALASCRLFVEHPIARMTGLCALIRRATPESS